MGEQTASSPFEVILPVPPEDKWRKEYHAFLRLLPQLLKAHRGSYVAIHDGQVVDSGDDEVALALRVFSRYGQVPIHVGLVSEQPPRRERIPTPRFRDGNGSP